jgi:hypothetical protein
VRAALRGRLLAEDGRAPVAHARVTLHPASGQAHDTVTGDDGSYAFDDLDPGEASVEITATGFAPVARKVTLGSGPPVSLDVPVAKALPIGQVRGLVRDFAGKPLRGATIHVEPVGAQAHVGTDGTFEIDVAPGSYVVVIHADGYADQKRRVAVERDGVTMLNVELRKGRK